MSVNTKAYARFSLAYFCFFLFLGGIISFWPLWLSEQGFNERQIGLLISVSMSTKLIAPSFWGWLADRSGRHLKVLQGCALLGTVSFCLIFVRTDFWFLFVALFMFSFFWDAVMPQIEVLTLAKLTQNKDESNYTLVRLWGSISFILVVLGLGLFFDYFSINTLPYFLLAFLCVFVASSLYLPNVSVERHVQRSPDVLTILKRPDVIGFLLVCALLQISHGPYYTWFSVYLKDLGYSLSAIGVLWTLSVIAEIVLFVFMRQLYKHVRLKLLLNITLLLTILRWLIIGNFALSIEALVCAQILHAFSYSCYHAIAMVLLKRFFTEGNEGVGMGIFVGVTYGVGGTVGVYVSGLLWAFSPWLCFMLAAAVVLLAYFVSLVLMNGPEINAKVM